MFCRPEDDLEDDRQEVDALGGQSIDSLQHSPTPDEFFNWPAKVMMKRFGFFKPYNVGPGWLQFAHPTANDVRSVLDLEFEHVLPGHGAAVIGNAKERYRPAIGGELKGCHT